MRRLVATALSVPVALIVIAALSYEFCPKPELASYIPYSRAYLDEQGELLRLTLAADDRYRLPVRLQDIAPELVEATLLYEDQHYYDHMGVDALALFRAFWTTYISQQRRIGASTIVMQLARLRWGIPSSTLSGKIVQILRAIQLSRHYSKSELLEAYLNLAPYGRNIEGIAAASLIYFAKRPAQLNLPEALTLAVIPQNPNKRNPTSAQGVLQLESARQLLFQRWLEYHPEDHSRAKFMDLALDIRSPEQLPFAAPHFVDYLQQQQSPWHNGYIQTTVKLPTQHKVERILQEYIQQKSSDGLHNAAALLVNYQTQSIEAMVGSADFFNAGILGQVNGAIAKRSPGSALKPFVYALAMDEGLVHPMSLLKDSKHKYGGFTPENFDKQFLGPVSVRDALIASRNVPAVELQSRLRRQSFHQFLQQAGVSGLYEDSYYGLALALGGGEVTALEMAGLYAMLANGGEMRPLRGLKQDHVEQGKRLLSPEASYLVLDILRQHQAPDALDIALASSGHNDVAWKTGTSWAFRDAWAAGISGPYVLIVWVGNFDGSGNNAFVGSRAAGPLFFRILDAVFPAQGWTFEQVFDIKKLNLKRLQVCASTGDLYQKYCPQSVSSWFIPGVSPIRLSNVYRNIPINIKTGKRACWHEPGKTRMQVYEFWPSDFQQIYQRAGIFLKTPPAFEAGCSLNQASSSGQQPLITSPQSSIEYVVRMNSERAGEIPLQATVDPDVEQLHWFIGGQYIASSRRDEAVLWPATPGQFLVRVVDDSGRSASKNIQVRGSSL